MSLFVISHGLGLRSGLLTGAVESGLAEGLEENWERDSCLRLVGQLKQAGQ
jgi:hypothetical protein